MTMDSVHRWGDPAIDATRKGIVRLDSSDQMMPGMDIGGMLAAQDVVCALEWDVPGGSGP